MFAYAWRRQLGETAPKEMRCLFQESNCTVVDARGGRKISSASPRARCARYSTGMARVAFLGIGLCAIRSDLAFHHADSTFYDGPRTRGGLSRRLCEATHTRCPDDHKREVQIGNESHDARVDTLPHPRH